jgi:hypothetical protein
MIFKIQQVTTLRTVQFFDKQSEFLFQHVHDDRPKAEECHDANPVGIHLTSIIVSPTSHRLIKRLKNHVVREQCSNSYAQLGAYSRKRNKTVTIRYGFDFVIQALLKICISIIYFNDFKFSNHFASTKSVCICILATWNAIELDPWLRTFLSFSFSFPEPHSRPGLLKNSASVK